MKTGPAIFICELLTLLSQAPPQRSPPPHSPSREARVLARHR